MQNSADRLVQELVNFFSNHFYEIVLIILVLAILDVVFFILGLNRKDKVIILSGGSLPGQFFKKLIAFKARVLPDALFC